MEDRKEPMSFKLPEPKEGRNPIIMSEPSNCCIGISGG